MLFINNVNNTFNRRHIRHGALIQVRSAEEILATLDENGMTDGMPFMPEMLRFCGGSFHISARINQTCTEAGKVRKLSDSVHLNDLRCDGSAHENCARCCRLFWKEAWLIKTPKGRPHIPLASSAADHSIRLRTQHSHGRYFCQSTELFNATESLVHWNPRRWYQGLMHRGLSPNKVIMFFLYPIITKIISLLARRDINQLVGTNSKTFDEILNLQPGERVQVKSRAEIIATLDRHGKNQGLLFTSEMLPFIGRQFTVKQRIEQLIDESTGRFRKLKNTVLLEGGVCDGSAVCGGCARGSYHLWRESWLKRVA